MSSEKMGQFISELRKSQQVTQKDLAAKLNVTDKAVSKWERGLSYPDIALLMPLANILETTAEELLNGERNKDAKGNEETSIAIESVLQYAGKAEKSRTRTTRKKVMLAVLAAAILYMGMMGPLLLYPNFMRWRNSREQQRIFEVISAEIALMQQEIIDEHFRRAEEVNASLRELPYASPLFVAHMATMPEDYMEILYVGGIMGRIDIPVINVSLPIYHTTSSWALDRGAGHMEGTAFPIGGYGNHPVIVAHSGLMRARMFKDLEGNVDIGDYFYITVLDRRLVYQVDQITVILPNEVDALRIVPGADIVTLMTCTPQGINSHRLLVRGVRVSG